MDSKEGIEKVAPANAQAAGILDSSHLWSGADDIVTSPQDTGMNPPQADSSTGSSVAPDGFCKWESYCLYVWVLKDSSEKLEQVCKVPEHCWNAGICKDICEAWTRVVMGTFSVDLLSSMEFLLYKLPKTGRGYDLWWS